MGGQPGHRRQGGADEVPFQGLSPEVILEAVEGLGWQCDGRLLALNSYENRVYQVGVEDEAPLVAKFYRPGRWSDAAIQEEHAFARELQEEELPVVAPLVGEEGASLHRHRGFRFALFPRCGGRVPELEDPETLRWMGRLLGRIHAVGATAPFRHRPALDPTTFGEEPLAFLLANGVVPGSLEDTYRAVARETLQRVEQCYRRAGPIRVLRLHGDCHRGNVLWRSDGPHFVDFDDCRTGPAVQDVWMLLSGDRPAMEGQLRAFLEGYDQFHGFDVRELHLVEALRALRMIHYSAWLARRWNDPAFPASFPWFGEPRYWEEQILALREQAALLEEPPLQP